MRLGHRKNPKPPLLVFIHIPKTAGTALRKILALNEVAAPGQALGNVFKGTGGVDQGAVRRLRHARGSGVRGARLVRGHVPLGLRDDLDDGRGLRCFTLLRDPVDRMLSHFFFVREEHAGAKLSDMERELGLPPLPPDPTLEDAITAGYLQDNLQTRMLSDVAEPFGDVTEEMLGQAQRNLDESLAFFGLAERFDESLVLARRRLGLRCILYRSTPRNGRINANRPRGDAVSPTLVAAAERANRYDRELYRYALQRFDGSAELGQPDYQLELAALRAAKVRGEIDNPGQAPPTFDGMQDTWHQLVRTAARAERLELQLAEQSAKSTSARSKIERLEGQVGLLERSRPVPASPSKLGENLDATVARMRELETEVAQLHANAGRRAAQVEGLVERLHATQERNRELQRELGSARIELAGRRAIAMRSKPSESQPKRAAKASARKAARPGRKRAVAKRRAERRRDDG